MLGVRILPQDMATFPVLMQADIVHMISRDSQVNPQAVVAMDIFCEDDGSVTVEVHVVDEHMSNLTKQYVVDVKMRREVKLCSSLVDHLMLNGQSVTGYEHFGPAPITQNLGRPN